MAEAMCEMPVRSPQVVFDGRPPPSTSHTHTSSWKDYAEMRRVGRTWGALVESLSSY